jgi:hypothetical protein
MPEPSSSCGYGDHIRCLLWVMEEILLLILYCHWTFSLLFPMLLCPLLYLGTSIALPLLSVSLRVELSTRSSSCSHSSPLHAIIRPGSESLLSCIAGYRILRAHIVVALVVIGDDDTSLILASRCLNHPASTGSRVPDST